MGQYYVLINLTKQQLFPDSASKMWEHIYNLGGGSILAMGLIELSADPPKSTSRSGSKANWSGDRFVFIGDYSDDVPPFLTKDEKKELQRKSEEMERRSPNLYCFAEEVYEPVESRFSSCDAATDELAQHFPKGKKTHHLVLNLDRKEYLDPIKFKEPATYIDDFAYLQFGVMQGLYSLLFYSTGSGGGDIHDLMPGRWVGQRLTIREKDKVEDLDSWKDISEQVAEDVEEYVING